MAVSRWRGRALGCSQRLQPLPLPSRASPGLPSVVRGIASSRLALGPLQSSGDPLPSTGTPHRGFVPPGKTSPSLCGIHSKSGRLLTVEVLGTELVQLQPAF